MMGSCESQNWRLFRISNCTGPDHHGPDGRRFHRHGDNPSIITALLASSIWLGLKKVSHVVVTLLVGADKVERRN
jgi:hypothetical protein